MLENGHSKSSNCRKHFFSLKKWIIITIISMIAVTITFFVINEKRSANYSFDETANDYFYRFNYAFPDSDKYMFHSLEAYYIEDDDLPGIVHYFFHAKYTAYIELLEKWSDIEEVAYGHNGKLENSFCLSWDNLDGFEDAVAQFNRAVKDGVKKTYTMQEIQKLIEKNRLNE